MASSMRQPLPPCCHAVHPGRKDTTKVRFKTELSKFAMASKQESFARLASALTEARSALQLDRGAVSALSGSTSSSSGEKPSTFNSVEDIQTYTKDVVTYLSLVKGFSTPPPSSAAGSDQQYATSSPFTASTTPTSALRQPLIDDHSPLNNATLAAGGGNSGDSATRSLGEDFQAAHSYSSYLSFCVWKDVLTNAQLHALNARHEYAQILLASGIYLMNDAREKVDALLASRLSELNETQLKLAYQLFLSAAGVFDACLESIDVKPRAVGAAPTDLSAEPEPAAQVNAVDDGNSDGGVPDDEMMEKWRAEQLKADGSKQTSAAATGGGTSTAKNTIPKDGDLAQIDRVPDLARGRYPQLLAWISLAEAQELVILRGISREFVDYALMAKLSMDVATRYRESHALAAQTLPCSTSPLADKMRLYAKFKASYYAAISCYFQGAAWMEKEDAGSCAQAIANFKKARSLMQQVLPLKQSYEEKAKQQKEERDRLDTFKSIYLRSQQIIDRDLDIMTHRNDSVYYERIPEPEPPCDALSLVRATEFPGVDLHALWLENDIAACLKPNSAPPTSAAGQAAANSVQTPPPRQSCCESCVISALERLKAQARGMDALTAAAATSSSAAAMDDSRDDVWTSSSSAMTTTTTTLSPALSVGEAENIAVCIRVRPLNEREVRVRDCNVLRTISAMNMISITDVDGAPLSGKHNVFQYDHIYDETSSTKHMYSQVAKRIVRSTLEGINGTIFAYGQTSSGKTYTMQGNGEMPFEPADSLPNTGILQLAVEDIFNYIESCDDRDFLLRVSFVEIYNEVVKDLLTSSDKGSNLKLREDPRKGVYVECKEEIITNYEDILNLLAQGNMRRTVGQTAMNERSSRSHSIFRIVIESKQKSSSRRQSEDDVTGAVLVACLSLVDLAGSESVRHTAAEGIRQREAGNINKSLLTLSRVINSLASASSGGQSAPFRDSKLTRLLQNSLDGNTRTLIICCVTPSDRYLDETKSTLQFAARAKDIQTSASVNEVLDDQAQLKRLKREVHELKKLVNNEALNALKAENEALMHEKSRHKEEYARLMGLILTSTTRTRPSSDSKIKHRVKRTRETWCPGDFPTLPLRDLENTRSAAGVLSPNPQPRKRRSDSDAKENLVPQNLLSALEEEMDDDNGGDTDGGGNRNGSSGNARVLSTRFLTVFELALQNYRGDNDENYRELNAAIEQVHDLVTREEDQERLSELLQDLKSLVDMSANSQHLRGENELLNMEVEELHRKLTLLENPSMSSQDDDDQGIRASLEALKLELTETQTSLNKERELVSELSREKQIAEQMAAEETKVLVEQIEALRMEIDEKEGMFGGEKQSLESALSRKADELTRLQSELSRQLEDAFTEIEEQKLLRAEDVGRLEKELLSKNAALEEQTAAFKELDAGIQENENLRDERVTLESMLREMEEARNTLQVKVSQLEEELKSSQHRNDQEVADISSKEEMNGAETKDLDESLEAQNQQLVSERANLTEAMMALEEQLQQTAKYHSDLDAQVKFLVEEKTALTEKVAVLESELAQSAGNKERHQSGTSEQDDTMECEKNEGEEEGLSSELQKLLQDMSKLQFELEQAKTEKLSLEEELKSLSSVKEQYGEFKQKSEEELERLRTELEYAANEKQASDINIQDLNEERAQLAEAIRSIKFEMEHLLGENNRKADQLELEVVDLRVVKEKRESEIASLELKLGAANEEMSRLKKKLVEFDEDKQSLLATVASLEALESKLQELLSERESHSAQVSGLESKLEALGLENARLVEKVQDFSSEKLVWLQKNASSEDLQDEIGAMQEEQSRLSLLAEAFETRLASKTDENEQNLVQVSKLAAEIAEYESTVADQSTAIEQLRAELSLSDEEQGALQSRIDELSLLEEQLAELEHENAQLKSQQLEVNGSHAAKLYELEEAKIQVEVQLSELENEKSKLLEQLNDLKHGGESGNGDQSQLFEKLTTLESEKQKLASEYDQVSSQRSELLDELSALEAQLMEESQEKMRLTTALEELEKKLRDIRRSSGDSSENVSDLHSELQRAREAESTLVSELEKLSAVLEKLEAENKSLIARSSRRSTGGGDNEDLDALHQRLDLEGELRATLELDVKSYEETLHVLRNELKDSSDTISDLVEKLKAMEVDMEHLTQAKEKAERETEIARELMQRAKEEQNELRFQNQQRVLSAEQKDRSLCESVESLEQQLKDAKQVVQRQQEALESQSHGQIESSEDNSSEMLKKTVADLQDQLLESRKALAVQEDAWKSKQSGAEKQFALLTSDLDNKGKEVSRLSQAVADAQSNEQELSLELTSVKRAYTELLQRKEELEQQLNEVDSQWRAREEELGAKVSTELLSVKKAHSEVVLQKERLEQQLSENDSQWRAKEQALSQQVAAEMDSLREQYQEAQEELDSYQKYADDEIHKLRASVESNDLEMDELTRVSKAKEEELTAQLEEQEKWVSHLKTKHEEVEAENSELYAERKTLEGKLETLLSSRDDAVDQLQSELRDVSMKYEQAEAKFSEASEHLKEMKSTMEKLEGEAYQHRNELEDMSESLKSSQMEAMHYHNQLAEVQLGKEELEKLVETQKKRIDKLEKVKMTTETLDLFRKLKKDREELQIKVQALQQELVDAEKSSARAKESSKQQTTRLVQRKEEELGMMREHIAELEQAVHVEKEKTAMMKAELKTTVRDVMDKSQQEIRDMQDVLRERAAQMEQLEQQVSALAQEKTEILAQKSGNVTYLEKENLELLVENRQLKKRLESSGKSSGSSSRVASALEDMADYDESAAAASAVLADSKSERASDFEVKSSAAAESKSNGESGFLIPSIGAAATKQEDEEEARPACAQQ